MAALPPALPIQYLTPDELRAYYLGGASLEAADPELIHQTYQSRVRYFFLEVISQWEDGGNNIPMPHAIHLQPYALINKELDQDPPLKVKVKEVAHQKLQAVANAKGIPIAELSTYF